MDISTYAKAIAAAVQNTLATDNAACSIPLDDALESWVDVSKAIRDERGVFFFIGNGASATMGEHMSHDCFQNANMLTQTCSETSHITAVANDFSYEDVFSFKISRAATKKDMLIAISSSGNSPNIVKALKTAHEIGAFTVTLTGKSSDNKARSLGDLNFYVPLNTYGAVESAHAILLHCWLDMFLEKYMGGRH